MKVEFGVLFDGKKGNGWRDINFELWIEGVKSEFYSMKIYYDRFDDVREYEVSYVDDIKGEVTVYRDLKKYKKNIDDWQFRMYVKQARIVSVAISRKKKLAIDAIANVVEGEFI